MERIIITRALLERYELGQCTPAECMAVERWLHEPDTVTESRMVTSEKENLWLQIAAKTTLDEHTGRNRQRYRPLWPKRLAAACVAVLALGIGAYLAVGPEPHSLPADASASNRLGALHIASKDKRMAVEDAVCQLDFDGYLQLINASTSPKTIIYNGTRAKTFVLEPGETYYLEKIGGEAYLIPESSLSPQDNYVYFVRGTFDVSCNAV